MYFSISNKISNTLNVDKISLLYQQQGPKISVKVKSVKTRLKDFSPKLAKLRSEKSKHES